VSVGFAAVEVAAREQPGVRLFTVLGWDDVRGALHRVHTSHPAEYPAGGEKLFSRQAPWVRRVVVDQQPYLGRDAEAVAEVFGDHELIASLGCGAVINVPVVDGGRTLGVLNLLDAEGAYDESSVVAAERLAPLALEPLRAWHAGRPTVTAPPPEGTG
jgi:GAF domain-containing protein